MKSIAEFQKQTMVELLKYNLSASWCFNRWYEKLILFVLTFLGIIKIFGWIF